MNRLNRIINQYLKPCFSITLLMLLFACDAEEEVKKDISVFLDNAKSYQDEGQFRAAIIETKNALQLAPADERGVVLLANIYFEIGQAKQAISLLETVEGSDPDVIFTLAKAYMEVGKFRSASEVLAAHEDKIAGREVDFDLLNANVALGQSELAVATEGYEKVLAADSSNTDAMLGLAAIEASRDDLAAVEAQLDALLAIEPENTRALLFLSSLKFRQGDLVGSESLLMNAMSSVANSDIITPLRYKILSALRDNLTQQGKTSEALIYSGLLAESMPGAIENSTKFQEAMNALARSEFDDARKMLAEIQTEATGFERGAGTMLGVIEYLQGDNEAAVRQFEQFIDPETASPRALQLFAMAELKLNQPEKVISRLSADIDSSRDGKLVALYGVAAVSAGDVEGGEKYLLKAQDLEPNIGRLRFPLMQLYNRMDRRDEALEQARGAFKSQPDDPIVQSYFLQQLLQMGRLEDARQAAKGIRASYPNSQESQLLVASYFFSQREYREAEVVVDKVLSLGESMRARTLLAAVYLADKDYEKAEQAYMNVIDLDPENSEGYKGLIVVYELRDKKDIGLQKVETLALDNGAATPLMVLSEYHGRTDDFDEAFSVLEKLDESDASRASNLSQALYLAKADKQFKAGDFDGSRKTIIEGLSVEPDNARLMALLVSVELASDSMKEAERVLAQIKALIPDAPVIFILEGDILAAKGDVEGGLSKYEYVWGRAPGDQVAIKIYQSLTRLEVDSDRLDAFVLDWNLKLPASKFADLALGSYYMASGDLEAAREGYERLLESNDKVATIHNNLAWIYGEEELDKAVEAGRRAYELEPQRGEIADTYAWFLYKNGDVEEAKKLIAIAAELIPDNQDIRSHYEEINAR